MYPNSIHDDVVYGGEASNEYYNIVKFYKMNFYLFPRMKQYDYVVWIDGTIEVHSETAAKIIVDKLSEISQNGFHIMLFEHTRGDLEYEARASARDKRWSSSASSSSSQYPAPAPATWMKNDVLNQLQVYQELGYTEARWRAINPSRPLYGLWVTCFIAFDMTDRSTSQFLQSWYIHTQLFSSQCQMSFSFLGQMNGIFDAGGTAFRPYSLPDLDIHGTNRVNTLFRKKRYHGSASI